MTRFLFVVPPLTGHISPLVAVAHQLAAGGHPVVWCGDPAMIRALSGPDAVVAPCPADRFEPDPHGRDLRGYPAVRYLWEGVFVPLADRCVDTVVETARRHRADVLVSDMQALAGPLAAARLGLPWATSATTSAPLCDTFAETPKVRRWLDGLLGELIARHAGTGTRRLTPGELELSPYLVIAFTTGALFRADTAPQVRFVGPALDHRAGPDTGFPWARLDGRPLVVTTMGTVNAAVTGPFLAACAEAFRLLSGRVQGVIADPAGVLGRDAPPDVITSRYLPVLDLAPRAAAVICHAGHNTVCETLAHGVPLVVAPIRDDQPVIAAQVVDAGAGVRLRFGRATPGTIRDAVLAVLDEPGYRRAAEAVRDSFAAAGSAAMAAEHLLALAEVGRLHATRA